MEFTNLRFLTLLIFVFSLNIQAKKNFYECDLEISESDTLFSGGSGTKEDPFLMSTLNDLVFLSENQQYIMGQYYFIQINDIDASSSINLNGGAGFLPIGNIDDAFFNGQYDGNGYVIDQLYINRPNMQVVSFMGRIANTGENLAVQDLGLTNIHFIGGTVHTGGFVGFLANSSIERCFVTGTLDAEAPSGFVSVATGSSIKNCYTKINIASNNFAFGFSAYVLSNIEKCYSVLTIDSNFSINSYASMSSNAPANTFDDSYYLETGISNSFNYGETGLSSSEMQNQSNFEGWDFENVWYMSDDNDGHPQLRVLVDPVEIYDYVYQDANWTPAEPTGNQAENSSVYFDDNYTINNDLSIGEIQIRYLSTVNVESTLSVNDKLNVEGELIFSSNENHIGQIGELPDGVEINGEVTVERYIPVNRSFRFVTSGVNSINSIHENWQENGESPIGFGTHITGSTTGSNGFDITETGNPSMFGFDNSNQTWFAVGNTDQDHLEAGQAYRLYIRGDRNVDLTDNESESVTTLRAKGTLETGNITFDNLGENAGDFNLIGNPYQAIVDLNEVNFTNINPSFGWVWDPNMNQDGAYVVVDLNDGSNTGSSTANEFLQPGQSLFLQTLNDGAASVTFTENAKNVDEMNNSVFSENQSSSLNLKLYKTETLADNAREIDALQINFNMNSNDNVDSNDASKLGNPGENLARQQGDHFLSLENRSLPSEETDLDLAIYNFQNQNQNYTLVLETENLENYKVSLNDRYTGESVILDENSNLAHFDFNIDAAIPANIDMNRFYLSIENTTLSVNDESLASEFTIYPNPVKNDKFTVQSIKGNIDEAEIKIFNLQGQNVFSETSIFESGKIQVQTEELSPGIYFVDIKQNNRSFKEKLIVE